MKDGITEEHINSFLRKTGGRGSTILKILGKNEQFMNAITSPLGEELLKDLVLMMEEKLMLIANDKAEEADKADYRAYKRLSQIFIDRIKNYKKGVEIIKGT